MTKAERLQLIIEIGERLKKEKINTKIKASKYW